VTLPDERNKQFKRDGGRSPKMMRNAFIWCTRAPNKVPVIRRVWEYKRNFSAGYKGYKRNTYIPVLGGIKRKKK